MIWKILLVAEKSWRALNAPHLMRQVYDGKPFKDGIAERTRSSRQGKPPDSFYTPIDKTSVHTYFANRHKEKISIKYVSGGKVVSETMAREDYHAVIRRFHEGKPTVEEIMNPLIQRVLNPNSRYMRIIGSMQRDREEAYRVCLENVRLFISTSDCLGRVGPRPG